MPAQKVPNMVSFHYSLNGKYKYVDTNFTFKVFDRDQLLCTVKPYSMVVETGVFGESSETLTSLLEIPVIPLDSNAVLSAQFEYNDLIIQWDINSWKYKDSLIFYDCHGLNIYHYTKIKKFPKEINRSILGNFRKDFPKPIKKDLPIVIIGWRLAEIEIEMALIDIL
jgi:hypothetical protein